ncbi:MAG TPA: Gldg family protein [Polyangiaceae bacterium]|nr:Gldg family protein [Polyangiaceae bacterium]
MEKRKKTALESGVLILVVAAILVAVNALSALGVYARHDVTKSEKFTLSKGSGNLLRSMKQDLAVDAYVTKGLPKLDAFVRDLRDLLQEYKNAGGGKFNYVIVEPKDEDTKKKAKDAGLIEQPFGEASDTDEKAAVTQGFMGLVFRYGEQQDVIKFLPPDRTDGLEFWISNKIREIRDKGDDVHHKLGVLTGHDEMKLTEDNLTPHNMGKYAMQGIITQNFPFYSFQDVDLKNGDSEVPDELDGLIITQPAKDLTEKELRRIDQFVMKGKSLAVFASAVNVKASDASMNATLSTHGLDKLLEGYGIGFNKDVVVDRGRGVRLVVPTSGGIVPIELAQVLEVQDDPRFGADEQLIDTSFPALFRVTDLAVPFASSLTIKADKQPGVKVHAVMRSSPAAVHLTGDSADLKAFPQKWASRVKGLQQQQFAVAAEAEGTLKSAFPDGDKQGVDAPAQSAHPARVFVLASAQFLANPLARAGNGPDMGQYGMMMPNLGGDEQLLMLAGPYAQQFITGTILVFKNTLDWLIGDTDLLAVSAKILSDPNLVYGDLSRVKITPDESEEQIRKQEEEIKEARKAQQRNIEIFLILGIPALLAGYGILRWRRRLTARANVSLA